MSKRNRISLTGADKFMLALEPEHYLEGTTGHTCKYVLELSGELDIPCFIQQVQENEVAQWLAQFYIHPTKASRNYWSEHFGREISFSIHENASVEDQLYHCTLDKNTAPLFHFDILKSKDTTTLIFSWHHLLMDGYGAVLFLQNLVSPINVQPIVPQRYPFNRKSLAQMIKIKRYITKSSSGKIAVPTITSTQKAVPNHVRTEFSQEETKQIEQNALTSGAKFGLGSYLLACTAQRVYESVLTSEPTKTQDLWVPVPHDMRKKGDSWPIVGNHLSFVYYRIPARSIIDTEVTVKSINEQLLHQIKNKLPEANAYLMHYLKKLPLSTYRRLIKGKNRKSIASFLFTVAAEHPSDFNTFFDCPISNTYSIPPNTDSPGIVVAFNRFEGKLSIVVQSYEHTVKREQLIALTQSIRINLLK